MINIRTVYTAESNYCYISAGSTSTILVFPQYILIYPQKSLIIDIKRTVKNKSHTSSFETNGSDIISWLKSFNHFYIEFLLPVISIWMYNVQASSLSLIRLLNQQKTVLPHPVKEDPCIILCSALALSQSIQSIQNSCYNPSIGPAQRSNANPQTIVAGTFH